jgi:hypothetical protein
VFWGGITVGLVNFICGYEVIVCLNFTYFVVWLSVLLEMLPSRPTLPMMKFSLRYGFCLYFASFVFLTIRCLSWKCLQAF